VAGWLRAVVLDAYRHPPSSPQAVEDELNKLKKEQS